MVSLSQNGMNWDECSPIQPKGFTPKRSIKMTILYNNCNTRNYNLGTITAQRQT